MQDWNVVVSVCENAYRHARARLKALGTVHSTVFHNVLALTVPDVPRFPDMLRAATEQDAELRDGLGRAVPVTEAFTFESPEAFETKARETAACFLPSLAGKRFYVRVHRRLSRAAFQPGRGTHPRPVPARRTRAGRHARRARFRRSGRSAGGRDRRHLGRHAVVVARGTGPLPVSASGLRPPPPRTAERGR